MLAVAVIDATTRQVVVELTTTPYADDARRHLPAALQGARFDAALTGNAAPTALSPTTTMTTATATAPIHMTLDERERPAKQALVLDLDAAAHHRARHARCRRLLWRVTVFTLIVLFASWIIRGRLLHPRPV